MAQLRSGILPLEIETSRYRNVPAEKIYWFHCKTSTETELYFSIVCALYDEERQKLMNKITLPHDVNDREAGGST